MSQVRCFTLLGDSNVKNNVNKKSCRSNPALKAAQILQCGHFQLFAPSFEKIRAETTACIVACVTNFLTSAEGPSVSQRVDPILQDIRSILHEACASVPERAILLSPPMYRASPVWYREGLPEILTMFSQIFSQDRPGNLHLLSSFATPEFDADGVHLTAYSGLEYIDHLFDSSQDLLDSLLLPDPVKVSRSSESTRVLEDRVMALEQDHRRLNRVVEDKIAIDSELADFRENERSEDCFVVEGLPTIADDVTGKDWQNQALKATDEFIRRLMGGQRDIVFIQNSTNRYAGAINSYTVKMALVSDSKAIRDKFGSFFVGGDKKPPHFKGISVKNRITPETKIRISILKLMAQRYKDSNPGSSVKVIGYQPRPLIKIFPAPSAKDRKVKSFNFIEAVRSLPTNFTSAETEGIIKYINPKFSGKLRSLFIVLSDDQFRKRLSKFSKARSSGGPRAEASGSSRDADGDAEVIGGDEATEAEADGQVSGPSTATSGSKGRTHKRGASSPADSGPPKK